MADGDKDVKIKISTEGGDQAKSTFASLIESLGGLGGAAVVANQGLELIQKGLDALEKPLHIIEGLAAETTNLFKEMRSLSAVTGETIEDAETLRNTFQLAGLSTEKLGFAMFRLSMNIEQGGKELQHMGVELKTAGGAALSTGEVFESVRNRIAGMENATARAAEAAKIFGARQARELLPILSMSAEAFERRKKVAEENAAMDDELAAKSANLIEAEANLEQKLTKLKMVFADLIALPVMQWLSEVGAGLVNMAQTFTERLEVMGRLGKQAADSQGGGFFLTWLGAAMVDSATAKAIADAEKLAKELERQQHRIEERAHRPKKEVTAEDVKTQTATENRLYQEAQARIKSEASISEALTRMRTDSDSEAVQEKIETNKKLIELAEQHYQEERRIALQLVKPGGQLSEQEEQKLSATRDKEIQKLTLENNKSMQVDLLKARVADAKKAADEEVKIAKDAMDRQTLIIESGRKREAAIIETSLVPATTKVMATYFSEAQAAKDAEATKIDAINREIDAKRKLAAAAPLDLHLQKQVNEEIMALNTQRVHAEQAADDKILEARKNLVQQLRAEADKQAQTGASLEEKALAALERRGKKNASMQDVQQEISNLRDKASQAAGTYGMGGRVNIAQLREARQLAPLTGQLRDEGITASQAVGMASQKSMADLSGQQWSAIPAQLQAAVGSYMQRLMAVESGVSTTLDRMTGAIEAMFSGFSSRFIRELEFQAARQ